MGRHDRRRFPQPFRGRQDPPRLQRIPALGTPDRENYLLHDHLVRGNEAAGHRGVIDFPHDWRKDNREKQRDRGRPRSRVPFRLRGAGLSGAVDEADRPVILERKIGTTDFTDVHG